MRISANPVTQNVPGQHLRSARVPVGARAPTQSQQQWLVVDLVMNPEFCGTATFNHSCCGSPRHQVAVHAVWLL